MEAKVIDLAKVKAALAGKGFSVKE